VGEATRLRRRWATNEIVVFPVAILGEKLSPTALRLWIALAQFANDERQCWPSRRKLMTLLPPGTAKGTLRRARAELEAAHLVEVEYRTDPKTGRDTTPLYTLLVPVEEGDQIDSPEGAVGVPPVGVDLVAPVGDQTVSPLNLVIESEQKEPTDVERVFAAWIEATGRHPSRTKLDSKRKSLIRKALKSHPVEDVLDAVVGWRHDPFYCGDNDRGKTFNALGLLLRDAEHIERFRDLARQEATKVEPFNENERRDADGVVTHRFYQGTGWTSVA
jgi:hypothetical protein